jgi:hypothetical protein
MSTIKKFRFVSPGVQVAEVDQSTLPRLPGAIGPVVVGRSRKGPAFYPVTVNSYLEFVETFGEPIKGQGTGDIWRDGNTTSPTYGAYAARAWLQNSRPLTFIRLLGSESDDPTAADTARAGWTTENTAATTLNSTNGGAVGLWVVPSGSTFASDLTGALAAVFYLDKGSMRLAGDDPGGTDVGAAGAAVLVQNIGSTYEFRMVVEDETAATVKDTAFNFDPNSSKYIRKVFNTNPTLTNDDVTPAASLVNYWLGDTFESHLKDIVNENSGNIAGSVYGFLAAIENSTVNHADFQGVEASAAKTGWIIGQDLNTQTGSYQAEDMTSLMRFVVNKGDGSGEWEQQNIKVSITDIQESNSSFDRYGTFTVEVRVASDTDAAKEVLEVYPQCNLNPNSSNYVARKIGDKYVTWDKTELRHRHLGDYGNVSKYVRVEMNTVVEQGGLEPELLPFGFFGPPRFDPVTVISGAAVAATAMLKGTGSMPDAPLGGGGTIAVPGITDFTASLVFPKMQMRVSSSDAGTLSEEDAYFGIITQKVGAQKFDEDYVDLTRVKPDGVDSHIAGTLTEYSFIFSLDDVVAVSGSSIRSYWLSGSRASGASVTAVAAAASGSDEGYKAVLNRGHDKFTMPLFGGFDGLDITERDPFRNNYLSKNGGTADANHAVFSLRRAIDTFRDPEVLDMNLATVPGITHNGTTNHLIQVAEDRADTLAIIDLEGDYLPSHESTNTEAQRLGSVASVVTNIKARSLNSSYAATYFPFVRINDPESGTPVWVPPSVVALGVMASSQEKTDVWFAPAGFNRGGLTEGAAGLQVVDARHRLTSKERDSLYEVNINPIASFPSEGVVIFGQKTLQATPSALDRINVRRLLIFVKKEISRIATRVLFDQNLKVTWSRFLSEVNPFLASVQTRFGLSDFKVLLDETTTTADLIDRNIMYAKIYLKPARSIEFIGLDFIVSRTGASFDDL